MLKEKKIAVVVPAYNEETQIGEVIESMPAFVDRIVIVNDNSSDRTAEVVASYLDKESNKSNLNIKYVPPKVKKNRYNQAEIVLSQMEDQELKLHPASALYNQESDNDRIILINMQENHGVGAAIARGYQWTKDHGIDCTAVMAGDGQMDPDELEKICLPVIDEDVDYVKGNRLIHRSAWLVVPKVRYIGNSILSILTKIASGYWHVSDTQTGYTAISLEALKSIRIHKIYQSYGVPNDIMVKLNIAMCTLKEVPIKPIYNVGEQSKMKVFKVIPTVSWLLLKLFFQRLWIKHLFRDFHPLFLLYNFAIILGVINVYFAVKVCTYYYLGMNVPVVPFLAFLFLFISSFQSLLFAMWMDIQENERLYR